MLYTLGHGATSQMGDDGGDDIQPCFAANKSTLCNGEVAEY